MATGPKKGLSMAKKIGSGPNNGGFDTYDIASGYATSIFTGDIVKLTSGKVEKAANGDTCIGVFDGCHYTGSDGTPVQKAFWAASTVPSAVDRIGAKVLNDPLYTFLAVADGTVSQVVSGNIYAMNLNAGSTMTGLSGATVAVLAARTGDVDISTFTDLGEQVTGLDDADTFTVDTTEAGQSPTTITIENGDGTQDLLDKLNAVDNISAELTSGGFLKITATNGYSLVLANGTGTPVDDLFAGTAATTAPTVAANAGLVKVQSVVDTVNNVLEVSLVNPAN